MSNYRNIENVFISTSTAYIGEAPALKPFSENLETAAVSLSTRYSFRAVSSNFQWFLFKSCSDWVSYFSVMSEV